MYSIRMKKRAMSLIVALVLVGSISWGEEFVINEDFNTLDAWVPVTFPKIEKHTDYDILSEGKGAVLVARSNGSASGIRYTKEFNVYDYPVVRWRWKVENVYEKGNLEEKAGDDYPLRVYIMFKYDPETAAFSEKIKYGLAKIVYGEYPPQSSLNYIWANKAHARRIYPSPYTERAQLVILRSGKKEVGKWLDERVNILADYQEAFGGQPPKEAAIAIMNDADNTGEGAVSYMDFIQVLRNE